MDKYAYLQAMSAKVADSSYLKNLLHQALTDRINDRETYMEGIDTSYYYEREEEKKQTNNTNFTFWVTNCINLFSKYKYKRI